MDLCKSIGSDGAELTKERNQMYKGLKCPFFFAKSLLLPVSFCPLLHFSL